MPLRLGTRASMLAQWQAHWVADHLRAAGHEVDLVPMTTRGDTAHAFNIGLADPSAAAIGPFGLFTKELQQALVIRHIDLAVHSLKDLPTDVTPGLTIAAIPERASPWDVLVSARSESLEFLPPDALIGTGSLRRRAQLLHVRPDLRLTSIRGNVDTRIKKLRDGQVDALILAEAGLARLGLAEQITQVLPPEVMLPAVGQGALAVECRSDDPATLATVAVLDHGASRIAAFTERAFLAKLAGGCLAPIGAYCKVLPDGQLHLRACVLSPDGTTCLRADGTAGADDGQTLAVSVAEQLLRQGAGGVLERARDPNRP